MARMGEVSSACSEVSSTMTSMSSSLERRAGGRVFDSALQAPTHFLVTHCVLCRDDDG